MYNILAMNARRRMNYGSKTLKSQCQSRFSRDENEKPGIIFFKKSITNQQ